MSVDLETAIEGAETFAQIDELLQGAEVDFVVIDKVWNGRQVTSPNHPGSIELLVLSKRVAEQFQQKGCSFEESKALKNLCERITNWYDVTAPEPFMYVTGVTHITQLIALMQKIEPEIEELSQEEAIQHLVKCGIFDEKKLPVLLKDQEVYEDSYMYDCDYFDRNDDPSLWYTEASWKHQFPGLEMPQIKSGVSFSFDGEEYASFSIFDPSQIEAAKAQIEALNRLGA